MLIAARDEDGTPEVHDPDRESDMRLTQSGKWVSIGCRVSIDDNGVIAELLCRNIPPGEKRVIDLEKSVIVHVAPPKTPVEELVEKAEELCKSRRKMACGDYYAAYHLFLDLESALARVKEAK